MLPIFGVVPTPDICNEKNKSAYIPDYGNSTLYLHNIATYIDGAKEIILLNRQIDGETLEVLEYITYYDSSNSPYFRTKIFCCRDFNKGIQIDKITTNPNLKNIEIYKHPNKDIFHDRYLIVEFESTRDIYLMGNHLSSIKTNDMTIAQIVGKCVGNLDEKTEERLYKHIGRLMAESKKLFPQEIQ